MKLLTKDACKIFSFFIFLCMQNTAMASDNLSINESTQNAAFKNVQKILSNSPSTKNISKPKKSQSTSTKSKKKIKQYSSKKKHKISLALRNTDIVEVMDMLSRKARINILVSKGIEASVSVNLYDVTIHQAIQSIANSSGYVAEQRHGSYYIIDRKEAGKFAKTNITRLRTFKVQYTKPKAVEEILKNHLSDFGKITVLEERNLLVIEDTPDFLRRIEKLLSEIDQRPKQILIEAKILEVTLDNNQSFGLDWKKLFDYDGGNGSVGTAGLATPGSAGFFLDLVTPNIEVALQGLNSEGRVRTLSTPKLLALENQEASVVIGDRIGYRLTTTINQVTSESIKFLESGVILKVKPSIDGGNRIMLDIHPEVSTGSVVGGIPIQKTTEVSTQILVNDGQTVFIGGLLKRTTSQGNDSVPILGDLPIIGNLFNSNIEVDTNSETVVMITPHIIKDDKNWNKKKLAQIKRNKDLLDKKTKQLEQTRAQRVKENVDKMDNQLNQIDDRLNKIVKSGRHNEVDLSKDGINWNNPEENTW